MPISLRQNSNLLAKLKEQLFKLWGDLEEQKSAYLNKHRTNVEAKKANPTTPFSTLLSSPPQKAGTQPDPDSDIENEQAKPTSKKEGTASILSEHETNTLTLQEEGKCPTTKILASNKAFTCCIKQYGVLIHEDDPEKANAGNGKRWQRKFGLFDTFII
jgi:protection-of-telomeres protein 1